MDSEKEDQEGSYSAGMDFKKKFDIIYQAKQNYYNLLGLQYA